MKSDLVKYFRGLWITYFLYVWIFQSAQGFEDFFIINQRWQIISRISLVVFPVYIVVFWLLSKKLTVLDYRLLYLTFLFWFLLTSVIGGKSGVNCFLIDIPIILLSFGIYLIKIPLTSLLKINNVSRFSVFSWGCIFLLILLLHIAIPAIPE